MIDLETRLRRELRDVADRTAIPVNVPSDPVPAPRPRGRRRARTVAVVGALTVAGASGVAIAVGSSDHPFENFPSVSYGPAAHATLLLTTTGPGDVPVRVYLAPARDGGHCLSAVPVNASGVMTSSDDYCQSRDESYDRYFGPLTSTTWPDRSTTTFLRAPGTTTLTLYARGKSARTVPVRSGIAWVWDPASDGDRVRVVGRDGSGTVTGRTTIDLR